MLSFVVDDPAQGFNNLYPLYANLDISLTESWQLPTWLDYYNIEYNTITIEKATPDSWYPIAINFWKFDYDYLTALPTQVKEKLSLGKLRVLFTYREADSPSKIRNHIDSMCHLHSIDPNLVLLLSGNTNADRVPGCRFFWYFDIAYYFQNINSPIPKINSGTRTHNLTCLSRTHKQWREWFVFNLDRESTGKNYYSYGQTKNIHDDDFVLFEKTINYYNTESVRYNQYLRFTILHPNRAWRDRLPLTADDLDSEQHNNHSIIVDYHYQNSYWNIVLETLLETEDAGGIFVTEKTLKPIRNGQSFIVLGCKDTLEFLHTYGYKTYEPTVDESYDTITDIRNRFARVLQRSFELERYADLDKIQRECLPIIEYNQQHFQRSRQPALENLCSLLANYRP